MFAHLKALIFVMSGGALKKKRPATSKYLKGKSFPIEEVLNVNEALAAVLKMNA
jgi:hypothetical protein